MNVCVVTVVQMQREIFKNLIMEIHKDTKTRELFTSFVKQLGFIGWHIHNGWVTNNQYSGDILHNEQIELTLIQHHLGYSHNLRHIDVNDKIVIIEKSPSSDNVNRFKLNCYTVLSKSKLLANRISLKRIEIKQAIFDKNKFKIY